MDGEGGGAAVTVDMSLPPSLSSPSLPCSLILSLNLAPSRPCLLPCLLPPSLPLFVLAFWLFCCSARKWTPKRPVPGFAPRWPNVRLGVFIPTVGRAELLDRLLDRWNASAAREPDASVKVYVLVDATTPERAAATHAVLARWPFAQALAPAATQEPAGTEAETAGWSASARRSVHLAHVYRQLLDAAFLRLQYRHAVLWEDDLLPSLDIVTYFAEATAALEADPSLWCASAWSDNSFPAVADDSAAVLRGEVRP